MAEKLDLAGVDMHAMFEAKMGFPAEDVPLDDTQLEKFLLLCRWGKSGKIYKSKKAAERQARAIYASGYKEKKRGKKK